MHPCAAYLNEVLAIVEKERTALQEEDLDAVEEFVEQRRELLEKAWNARAGYEETQLMNHLQEVEEAQQRLMEDGKKLQAELRRRMNNGNKQRRYFDGDRHIHSMLKRSFYCDTIS